MEQKTTETIQRTYSWFYYCCWLGILVWIEFKTVWYKYNIKTELWFNQMNDNGKIIPYCRFSIRRQYIFGMWWIMDQFLHHSVNLLESRFINVLVGTSTNKIDRTLQESRTSPGLELIVVLLTMFPLLLREKKV